MTFKQNLPAVVILGSAAASVGLIVLLQPPDEDLLRRAVAAHVKTMQGVRDFKVEGETADVLLADGSVRHLAFAKRPDGAWGFDRDLASKPAVILVLGWTATFDIVDRDSWVGEHRPELARVLLWIRRLNLAALVALSLSLSISVLAFVSQR